MTISAFTAETATTVEMTALAFLNLQPMHGYELHRRMDEPGGPGQVWGLKLGQLYGLLGRLETAGLIESETLRPGSRPPRRVFRLTADGAHAYREWIEAPVAHARLMRQDFLIKLYFARCEPGDIATRLIKVQRATCRAWLDANRLAASSSSAGGYDRLVREFRAGQIQAMIEWLDRCAEAVSGRMPGMKDGRD